MIGEKVIEMETKVTETLEYKTFHSQGNAFFIIKQPSIELS